MASKLSSKQLAKLAVLETFPARFDTIHRLIEEMGTMRADESQVRRLARTLDEMKAAAGSIGETGLVDTLGVMATLARRTGGLQTRVRGLREGFGSLKINLEGAIRAATREEDKDQVDEADLPKS
ncbi:MAG: hypothetical protein R2909_18945 [Gemmatimonadales bacterium]